MVKVGSTAHIERGESALAQFQDQPHIKAARQVWVLVSGELTQDCITDMRELYGLPAKDCDSAELLLDLYEEVLFDLAVISLQNVTSHSLAHHRTLQYVQLHSLKSSP